jgi:hypothetical protein
MQTRRFVLLVVAALGLASAARAQATDDFSGGFNPAVPWRWDVPGNTPVDTREPAAFAFTRATLDLGFSPAGLYGSGGFARNLPNLVVLSQPASWFVETAVSVDWSQVDRTGFPQANLAIFDDADNLFFFHYVQDAAQPDRIFLSTNVQNAARGVASSGGGVSGGNLPRDTSGFVRLRIEGTPNLITLLYDAGAGFQSVGTLSAASTGNALNSWNYLSEGLTGRRVGLFATLGGAGFATTPARYDYFTTNLDVIPEPGTLALAAVGLLPIGAALRHRRS